MDIDGFVAAHEGEWKHLWESCARGPRGLARRGGAEIDEVVRLYLRVSGHLADVQTRYRDPALEAYLTHVVACAHAALYGAEPRSIRSVFRLFAVKYPGAVRRTLPYVLVAAVLTIGVTFATAVWVGGSHEAQAGVLPPMVREFMRRPPPDLGAPPASVSLAIFLNNVRVSLIAFAAGIAVGIPTLYIVVQNAVLLGALAGLFGSAGKAGLFWSLILPHGLLELTAIFIAAGAGLRVGWSLIDPKDRPRGRALAEESRDAVLVAVGVVPALVVAAVIEGFLTPTGVSGTLKIAVGVVVAGAYAVLLAGPALYRRPKVFARK